VRVALTILAAVLSLCLTAVVVFFAVLILAGPHSSMVPSALQPAVLVVGWLVVVVVPLTVARWVWRRFAPDPS
jgi:hypothetical protein